MPFSKRLALLSHLPRLLTSLSVRTRIVVLALIPVAGFLANGITYMSGEDSVGKAYAIVQRSDDLASASRDFKTAVTTMRLTVKDFDASPSQDLIDKFTSAYGGALNSLATIAVLNNSLAPDIAGLHNDVEALRANFDTLVTAQRALGFTDHTGLRGRLFDSGNAVERIINQNLTWLAEGDARKLMVALLTMRHYETEYRLNQEELNRQLFLRAFKDFNAIFGNVDGTPEMKDSLENQVKVYADIFKAWVDGYSRAYPMRAMIDADSESMLPRADKIIAYARATSTQAAAALAQSQRRTRVGIIAVGIAMVLLGLGFSWLIGRTITRPLHGLAGVMQRLAAGDTSARIPATHARDEIGEMARSVIVFRDTMIEQIGRASCRERVEA